MCCKIQKYETHNPFSLQISLNWEFFNWMKIRNNSPTERKTPDYFTQLQCGIYRWLVKQISSYFKKKILLLQKKFVNFSI